MDMDDVSPDVAQLIIDKANELHQEWEIENGAGEVNLQSLIDSLDDDQVKVLSRTMVAVAQSSNGGENIDTASHFLGMLHREGWKRKDPRSDSSDGHEQTAS